MYQGSTHAPNPGFPCSHDSSPTRISMHQRFIHTPSSATNLPRTSSPRRNGRASNTSDRSSASLILGLELSERRPHPCLFLCLPPYSDCLTYTASPKQASFLVFIFETRDGWLKCKKQDETKSDVPRKRRKSKANKIALFTWLEPRYRTCTPPPARDT